jgi:hypothetical protein
MHDYWQQTISLQFQVHANGNVLHDHGYWANPRFVINPSDLQTSPDRLTVSQ